MTLIYKAGGHTRLSQTPVIQNIRQINQFFYYIEFFYRSFTLLFTTICRCHVAHTANDEFHYDFSLSIYRLPGGTGSSRRHVLTAPICNLFTKGLP